MPDEKTFTARFKVEDDGSIVLDKISGKLVDLGQKSQDSLGKISRSLSLIKLDALINLGERAFHTGEQIFNLGRSAASSLNDIDRLSKVAGISTDDFQKMQYAAKMTDVAAEDLAIGIKKLSVNMDNASRGTGDAAREFHTMGISVTTPTGSLKSLDEIMMQIADQFSRWEDGPRKIAIAVDLFGRSGERLIPYLNQGAAGIQRFYQEAEKLGIVLDKDLIAKGTELEDRYKKASAWWDAFWKKSTVQIYEAIKALQEFNSISGGLEISATGGLRKKRPGTYGAEEMMAWEPGPTPIPRVAPPAAAKSLQEIYKENQPLLEQWSKMAEILEKGAYGGWENAAFWQSLKEGKDIEQNLHEVQGQLAQQMAEDMFPAEDKVRQITDKMTEGSDKLFQKLSEMRKLIEDFGWENWATEAESSSNAMRDATETAFEDYTSLSELSSKAMGKVNEMAIKNTKSAEELQKQQNFIDGLVSGIANTWTSSFSTMRRSQESFSDWFKKMWLDMADYAIGQLQKIAINYALFGSAGGGKGGTSFFGTSGGGYGGIIGGILSIFGAAEGGYFPGGFVPFKAFQGGGYVNRPTLGMIGEGGEGEWVIPDSKMRKGQGDTYITVNNVRVDATDVQSFEKRYGPSILSVSERSARGRGAMHKIMRRY
jgi:hypothetical protein